MQPFTFHNPVRLHLGAGKLSALTDEVAPTARVLLTMGGGSIERSGVLARIRSALAGRDVVEFTGIEANPDHDTLMKAVGIARQTKRDLIIAAGGGSVLDGSKFIAAAVPMTTDPWAMVRARGPVTAALPLGAVLTLPATGSEMNGFSVVSRRSTGEKLAFGSPLLLPRFAILDPDTTATLPRRQVINGIVDPFVHVLEQYCNIAPTAARLTDRLAESILTTLVEIGPGLVRDYSDVQARTEHLWCACMALNGIIGQGVPQDWATHAIGHELTALYDLDHAQTLAIVSPALLAERSAVKRAKLAQLGRRVFAVTSADDATAAGQAIDHLAAFFTAVGNPTKLSAYRIDAAEAAPRVVANLARGGAAIALGEDGKIDAEMVARIVRRAA